MPRETTDSAREMQNVRLVGTKMLLLALNKTTIENSVRCLFYESALHGEGTKKDLSRTFLYINNVYSNPTEITKVYDDMSPSARLLLFPLEEICKKTGIKPEAYTSVLDAQGDRRESFCKLKLMFERANAVGETGGAGIPNPLLLEELVSTLNQSCVEGYPNATTCAIARMADKDNEYLPFESNYKDLLKHIPRDKNEVPIKHSVHMRCTEPNKVSVYLHFFPYPWIGGFVSSNFRYDVSLNEATGCIEYSDVYTCIALPSGDNPLPENKWHFSRPDDFLNIQRLKSILADKADFQHQFEHFPEKYPLNQFTISGKLDDFSIKIQEMLSLRSIPQDISLQVAEEYANALDAAAHDTMPAETPAYDPSPYGIFPKGTFKVNLKRRIKSREASIHDEESAKSDIEEGIIYDTKASIDDTVAEKSHVESSIAHMAIPSTHEATDATHAEDNTTHSETSMTHEETSAVNPETDTSHPERTTLWQHIGNKVRSAYTAVRELFLCIVRFFQRVCSTVASCVSTPNDESDFARDNTQTSSSEDSRVNEHSLSQEETHKSGIESSTSGVPAEEHTTSPQEKHVLDSVDISHVAQHSQSNLER
ncbi:hypothetical protein [Anaplasma phagocytophilum]|uniref:Uncharacterized protein n=1 Tax=Anaplasma phagocytophilum TaxID=948 RepID=A0A098EDQ4_ANAPH|nr:hypothetical protein [Anaplasma phagocytophilum]CEG20393.1 Uncharacterized protein ANAPHAGO_00311 [Anaplasma phagocytophilum]